MQTKIIDKFLNTPQGQEADSILRNCVHCGFCTATCPTYQQLNDERDGPRGRIYLLKQFLEGGEITQNTRKHLDRCLSCRSCETTCPSGVHYSRLLDIGRAIMEQEMPRPKLDQLKRWTIRKILPYPLRFGSLLKLGQFTKPYLPKAVQAKIPAPQETGEWPRNHHPRKMLVLAGCAQSSTTPRTNAATARVLDKLGIRLIVAPKAGCCGAVSYHMSAQQEGLDFMRRNIDAWWPTIEAGVEAIIMTASGCGAMVKEYGELLAHDPNYADKAQKVSELSKDLSEVLIHENVFQFNAHTNTQKTAFHCPCTLQHAQQLPNQVEKILQRAGIELVKTNNKHLCCGSAGTYSLLQPELSQQLLNNKLRDLSIDNPSQIITANVGCQLHLASKSKVPVKHWIELLDVN